MVWKKDTIFKTHNLNRTAPDCCVREGDESKEFVRWVLLLEVGGGSGQVGAGIDPWAASTRLHCQSAASFLLLLPFSLHFVFLVCFCLPQMLVGAQCFSREVLLAFC